MVAHTGCSKGPRGALRVLASLTRFARSPTYFSRISFAPNLFKALWHKDNFPLLLQSFSYLLLLKRVSYKGDNITLRFYTNDAFATQRL